MTRFAPTPGKASADAAVMAALKAAWTMPDGAMRSPVQWPDAPGFSAPDAASAGAFWIRPAMEWGEGFAKGLGGRRLDRWAGLLTVSVFVPRGIGDGLSNRLCDELAAVFSCRTLSAEGFVKFGIPQVRRAADDPPWTQQNVRWGFRRDRHTAPSG